MPFIKFTEQEKESANTTDIVEYLATKGESVKRSGREYIWDSPSGKVTIHGSEWYSQYEQVGGGAVNFVRKFFGLSYPDAIRSLLGSGAGVEMVREKKVNQEEPKKFVLPPKHGDMRRVYGYLLNERYIDRDVLNRFAHEGLIYEDAERHNAVFVGKDKEGVPRHAHKRSTAPTSEFKGNLSGCIAEYSFHYTGSSKYLFVFEAPIDMLAYISLHKEGWENHSYVSLCSTADRAALQMLKDNPNLETVILCLDHDNAGIEGCYRIAESIRSLGDYTIGRCSPKNKDWDEDLKEIHGKPAIPSSECVKLVYIKQACDSLLSYSVNKDSDCEVFVRYPSDVNEDGIKRLWKLYNCREIDKMVKTCIAMCQIRERKIGIDDAIETNVASILSNYKPHRDTESSSTIYESMHKKLSNIEHELTGKSAVTALEVSIQNHSILSLALDCLRYNGAVEREIIAEQANALNQAM